MAVVGSRWGMTGWHVLYGLVALGTGAMVWHMVSLNRFLDAGCIALMGAGAIWVSAANVFYDDGPPPDGGTRIDY